MEATTIQHLGYVLYYNTIWMLDGCCFHLQQGMLQHQYWFPTSTIDGSICATASNSGGVEEPLPKVRARRTHP